MAGAGKGTVEESVRRLRMSVKVDSCRTPRNAAAFWRMRFAGGAAVLKKRPGTGWITPVLVYVHSQKQARPKQSR